MEVDQVVDLEAVPVVESEVEPVRVPVAVAVAAFLLGLLLGAMAYLFLNNRVSPGG